LIIFNSLPVVPLRITSKYGPRNTGIVGASTYHLGVDIGTDKSKPYTSSNGGPVTAVLPGTVCGSYYNKYRGWVVLIDHGTIDGQNVKTLYQHLKQYGRAKGTVVKAGDTIGIMGNTGVGAQLHLHFEVRINNTPVNPEPYLKNIVKEVGELTEAQVKAIVKEVLAESREEASAWAANEWQRGQKLGITDGTRPQAIPTREQVVSMIVRSIKE